MKTRLLIIIAIGMIGFTSSTFAQDLPPCSSDRVACQNPPICENTMWDCPDNSNIFSIITESTIQWKEAMFGIKNGTGFAELIITDSNANQNPTYREKIKAHVHSDFDPIGNTIELYETEKNSGIFERKFAISLTRTAPEVLMTAEGDTITASYGDLSYQNKSKDSKSRFTALVGSLGVPFERVLVSNPIMTDLKHNVIDNLIVEQQSIFITDLVQQQDWKQNFVWILQIQDDKQRTVMLSWINGTIYPNTSFSPSASWIPKQTGHYSATFFVWERIDNPSALSPPIWFEFDVVEYTNNVSYDFPYGETGPEFNEEFCNIIYHEPPFENDTVENKQLKKEWIELCLERGLVSEEIGLRGIHDVKENTMYYQINGQKTYIEINIPFDKINGVFQVEVNGNIINDQRVSIIDDKVIIDFDSYIKSVKLYGVKEL
jgi:hypothetical protein